MRLIINRSQQDKKGMLGGHKGVEFTLSYRLELTDEESQLVQHYRLENYAVTTKKSDGVSMPDDTISNMVAGRTQTVSDVGTLLHNEDIVKSACDALPGLFMVVRTFGGDEVIDYPR